MHGFDSCSSLEIARLGLRRPAINFAASGHTCDLCLYFHASHRHRRLLRRCCCRTSRLEIRFRELGQLFSRYPSPPPLSAFPPFSRLSLSHSSSHISTVTFLCRVGRVAGSCGSRSRGANMCDPDGVAGRCQNVRWHLLHGFKRCTICDPRFWAQLTGMQHVTKDGYAEV